MKGGFILKYCAEFESSFEQAEYHAKTVRRILTESNINISQERFFIIDYAIRELLNNAVEHGNQMNIDRKVKFSLSFNNENFEIDVYDQGNGFDLKHVISNLENFDILQYRNRGLSSILLAGFKVQVDEGHVHACITI